MIKFLKKLFARRNKDEDVLDGEMKKKIGEVTPIDPPVKPKKKDK